MATRTDESAVRNILQTSLSSPQVRQFIADANLWVTEELADAGLTVARLELIERYLAAALVRTRDLGLSSAGMTDVRESYQVDPTVTDYLLRAAAFDTSGKVRRMFLAPKDRPSASGGFAKGFKEEYDEQYPEG